MRSTPGRRRALLSAAGFGCCAAGAITVAVAAWVLPDDRAVAPDATAWIGWLAVLVLTTVFAVGCYWWTGEQSRARIVAGALCGLAFAAVVVRCVFVVVAQHGDGLVGRTPLVALYGAALGVAGSAVVVLLSAHDQAARPDAALRSGVSLGVVVVLVTACFAVPTPIAWGQVSHSSDAMRPGVRPASVSRVAWHVDVGQNIADAARVTGGVAVLTDRRVVGVRGSSGERTWEFARPGASLLSIESNGGSRVSVLWVAHDGPVGSPYLTVLDGATGHPLFTRPQDLWDETAGDWHLMSGASLVVHRDGDPEVAGYSLDTGERRWTFAASKGCRITRSATWAKTGVVFEEQCGARGRVIAVGDDGAVRWQHDVTMHAPSSGDRTPKGLPLSPNIDGTLMTVRRPVPAAATEYRVIETRTGHRMVDRQYGQRLYGSAYAVDRWSGDDPMLRNVRTGKTVDARFRTSACDGVMGWDTDLRDGFACLSSSSLTSLARSGSGVVTMQSWSGKSREFELRFGAPVDTGSPGGDGNATLRRMQAYYLGLGRMPVQLLAAEGAVVAWAPWSEGTELVGLR